jgi:diaminopimelate decarboxylase
VDAPVGGPVAIDDCLSIRDGHLWVEGCDTVELARTFGTPIHVVSEDQLRRNVRRTIAAFRAAWPEGDVVLLPSIKANYTLALRRILTQEGTGCDTFGPGELEAALRTGVPPETISVNGSVKAPELIARAVDAGCRITLDSVREIELERQAARDAGRRAVVRFRVRPDYDGLDTFTEFAETDVPIRLAASAYKPGIPTEDLLENGPEALATEELDVAGVMAHLGRHHHSIDVWRAMASSFADTIGALSAACGGWTPREIDVGGGFASPRDPTGRATTRGMQRPAGERSPTIEAYAEAVATSLRDGLGRHGIPTAGVRLEAEPGRALLADTGIHLATVRNVKAQTRPIAQRWVELDTTEMFLPDGLIEHNRWTAVVASGADRPVTQEADVVGMSCGFDVLVAGAALPDVEPGDVVAILDTGAYQDAASSNFNGLPRPATILVHGNRSEVVKRAEKVDDVFRRDIVPERLGGGTRGDA